MPPDVGALLPPVDAEGADLPVRAVLPTVIAALRRDGTAILVSPPGSGKTSLLPLALADAVGGRVIVAEPRRIATRAAARRMAQLIGEQPGERIGFAMRGERRVSAQTRIEVVTTGLLVRRLQRDPELAGVDAVVIDEVHERQLDTDLALAFCLDIQANLRPDLSLIATSATPDTERLATVLGAPDRPAPIVTASGAVHPVEVIFAPPPRPIPLLPDARVDPRLLDHVAGVVRRALSEGRGDVLVFLPGEAEIASVARRLGDVDLVVRLFGRQSSADQDLALEAGPRRRVVLATAVAESSLTVPGVRIVVDAGLSREPRIDHSRGLGTLTTTKVSLSSARQRAGRAGREGPGRAFRCWSEIDETHLAPHQAPEIALADLTGFALAVADWGHPGGDGLGLMDQPPRVAMESAVSALQALGALDDSGRITGRGRRFAQVAAPPRLARALLDGADQVGGRRAAEIVALISADIGLGRGDDLVAKWRDVRGGRGSGASAAWRDEVSRLSGAVSGTQRADHDPGENPDHDLRDDLAAGIVVGLAFPERLARRRDRADPAGRNYLMAAGTGAQLSDDTQLRGSDWLAVAVADRAAGRADARIRLAAPLDASTVLRIGAGLRHTEDEIVWQNNGLVLHQREYLGAIVLVERPLADPDPDAVAAAIRDGLRSSGLGKLNWTSGADLLRRRLALLHRVLGSPWPEVTDAGLLDRIDGWLGPDLRKVRRAGDLTGLDLISALRRLLPWPAAERLAQLAPERMAVPSGSIVRIDYSDVDFAGNGLPKLAVKVQEMFGSLAAPAVVDGRVPVVLHLLSPGGRPTAITSDLASFWRQGYPQVRAELRSRYPRHSWPDDPSTAPPSRRPPRRT